jgi:outer membrane protein TolC
VSEAVSELERIVLNICRRNFRWLTFALLLAWSFGPLAHAQTEQGNKKVLTLEEAVDFALKHYPAVRASLERSTAAQAGVGLARTTYLPRADTVWQTNRATDNNITGLLLPLSIIAPISGPVPATASGRSAWGSAAGLLFSWEPLDFGYRGAKVDAARAVRDGVAAEASLTRLNVAVATVNAYLTVLAAERTVRAAEADVQRRETFTKAVHVLTDNQLRAGADASRADAEWARARVNLARARQQEQVSRAILADILGMPDTSVEVREDSLHEPPPDTPLQRTALAAHPGAEAEHARVAEAQAQVHALDRAYFPKFYLQSSVYGRGSGIDPAGNFLGGSNGLGPDRGNWAAGVSVTFPAFDIFAIRSKRAVEAANERAEAARYDQTLQDLTGQLRKAEASLEGARQVAENTPVELDAARATENQERTRYQTGLATLVEVADAQSLLVQAETDDALARLAVWQNLAAVAASHGDLQPFLQLLHDKTQGGQ